MNLAVLAHRDATASEDVEAVLRARDPLRWLLERAPATALFPEVTDRIRRLLADAAAEWRVLVPLYRGTAARDAGDPDTAATSLAAALAATGSIGSPVVLTAAVLVALRGFDDAVAVVEPAWRAGRLPTEQAASLFLRLGRFDLAQEATAALPPDDPDSWEGQARRAELALGTGRLDEAAAAADTALTVFEGRLEGLPRDVLRTAALDSWPVARLYATAVRIHAALADRADGPAAADHLARSFALSDRSRGMTLTDLVDTDRHAATPAVAATVRDWQRAGAELGRTIEDLADTTPTPAETRARIDGAERDLDDAEAALASRAPDLFRNRRRLPVPVTVRQAQELLSPGTLLVQYHAFDDRIVVFTVTDDSAAVHTTSAVTGQLTCDVRRFHRAVADPGSTAADREELGTSLARRLLDPVVDAVNAHSRVVVVPSGGLAVLPFHVLPWGDGELGTGDRVVSYLPAVSAASDRPAAGSAAEPLVLGDPAYAAGGPRRLPGTGVEARAVAALYGAEPLVGAEACRDAVLERLGSASLVHLATHGFLREAAPYSAYLALAGTDRLTVPDLMGLGLHVDLAVLSACDSGRGRATAAGDVIGLTRALLGSGVRGLVVSLWPVDDTFACLTMVAFHERLRAGSPPAQALAEAAADLRRLRPEEATARYELRTGQDRPSERTLRTTRDIGAVLPVTPGDDPAHPSSWAPFGYVGVP